MVEPSDSQGPYVSNWERGLAPTLIDVQSHNINPYSAFVT